LPGLAVHFWMLLVRRWLMSRPGAGFGTRVSWGGQKVEDGF
jgi:hypothetical protein